VYSGREMRAAQIFLLTTCVATSSLSAAGGLKVGDPAPQFSLAGSDGKSYSLASFKGKQVVVLAWFAKAFTGG
jgi:peroxiredoxin Q/BCP